MESLKLLSESNVRQRLQSCLRAKEFNALSFRGIVMGTLLTTVMADVTLYIQLRTSIRYGQLPWYITDVLIMTIGFLEAVSAPFWSWFGRWRLRTLTFVTFLVSVTSLGILTLPSVPLGSGTEFCTTTPATSLSYTGMTTAGAVRLTIIVMAAVVNVIGKAAVWNNAIILLDETDPKALSLNYGILVAVRVMAVILLPRVLNEDMAPWAQSLGVFVPLLINAFQFYRLPAPAPQEEKDLGYVGEIDTSVCASLGRVLCSGVAMGQIFAMALLTAALWGFAWHNSQILRMMYYIVESTDFVSTQTDFSYYHALILAVVTYGMYYTRPAVFNKVSAMKLAAFASLIVAPMYCAQTMLITCQTGLVAGLESNYTQPACSSHCECAAPYSEFDPVCVTDPMTTYMSPCHAGCVGQDTIGGLTAYRGCACAGGAGGAGTQRATPGACSAVQCRPAFTLHKVVTPVIVILTVLALQAQLVIVLRSVEQRDRPLAVGLSTAVVLFATFVCAHLAYFGIQVWTCAWSVGGRCVFHTPAFLYAIGGTSTGLAAVSAVISLVTWLVVRRRTNLVHEDIALARRESRDVETRA